MHTFIKPNHTSQTGAVLIVSLVLLLVMTLIGVTAMQTTVMQERMAGNSRDVSLAFQAAEAATREGETWLASLTDIPDPNACSTGQCLIWDAYKGATALNDASGANSYTDGTIWMNNARSSALNIPGLGVQPGFVVEFVDLIRDSQNLGQQQDLASSSVRNIYAVTARGTGVSAAARAFVQTNFARRF